MKKKSQIFTALKRRNVYRFLSTSVVFYLRLIIYFWQTFCTECSQRITANREPDVSLHEITSPTTLVPSRSSAFLVACNLQRIILVGELYRWNRYLTFQLEYPTCCLNVRTKRQWNEQDKSKGNTILFCGNKRSRGRTEDLSCSKWDFQTFSIFCLLTVKI